MRPARAVIWFWALAALAAVLQAAEIAVPGPGGQLLALTASLPAAVGALMFRDAAPWLGAAAVGMLAVAQPQAALEFALTTGPLGLVVGYGVAARRGTAATVARAGLALVAGTLVLTAVAGRPVPGAGLGGLGDPGAAAVYMGLGMLCAWAGARVGARVTGAAGRRKA